MNKLSQAIAQSKHAKPYYRKIILDLLVQLTTEGTYKSLKSYKSARVILTGEQKEMLKAYTDSIILLLGIGMEFHDIKQFLTTKKPKPLPTKKANQSVRQALTGLCFTLLYQK